MFQSIRLFFLIVSLHRKFPNLRALSQFKPKPDLISGPFFCDAHGLVTHPVSPRLQKPHIQYVHSLWHQGQSGDFEHILILLRLRCILQLL